MMKPRSRGFTLLELMTVVAIIAILGAVAVIGYQKYTARAQGADIIEKYDAIRTGAAAKALGSKLDDCSALVGTLDNSNLVSEFATLAYGFEAVSGGYRPVLTVCAKADASGPRGVQVARGVYDTMVKTGSVEKGAVVTDSVVSFALRLTSGDEALCRTATNTTTTAACGSAAQPPVVAAISQADCQPGLKRSQTDPTKCVPDISPQGQQATAQTLTQSLAQIPAQEITARTPQQQASVTAAVQGLIQGLAQAATVDEAREKTIAAARSLPPELLTQSVLQSTAQAKAVAATCNLHLDRPGPCRDNLIGGAEACQKQYAGHFDECVPAIVCPKTAGLCQGVTPEMRRLLDASMQRMLAR